MDLVCFSYHVASFTIVYLASNDDIIVWLHCSKFSQFCKSGYKILYDSLY